MGSASQRSIGPRSRCPLVTGDNTVLPRFQGVGPSLRCQILPLFVAAEAPRGPTYQMGTKV